MGMFDQWVYWPMEAKVTSNDDGLKKLAADLQKIAKTQVLVGVPEEKTDRKVRAGETVSAGKVVSKKYKKDRINNAQLMYIHTNGSPVAGIPARAVIEPAIEAPDNRVNISNELGKAVKSYLDQNPADSEKQLKRAGMVAQNACRAWFEDPRNNWPPNSPLTIAKKGSDKPLIDTAQLRKSIIYVVRNK